MEGSLRADDCDAYERSWGNHDHDGMVKGVAENKQATSLLITADGGGSNGYRTKNWRGKPLVTHQVIVELIAATTTRTGHTVRSRIDSRTYAKGRQISDTALAGVNLEPDEFHGEWNYTIHSAGR